MKILLSTSTNHPSVNNLNNFFVLDFVEVTYDRISYNQYPQMPQASDIVDHMFFVNSAFFILV